MLCASPQAPAEEQEREYQRLRYVAGQRAFSGAAEQGGGQGKPGAGKQQDGSGNESRYIGKVFPLKDKVPEVGTRGGRTSAEQGASARPAGTGIARGKLPAAGGTEHACRGASANSLHLPASMPRINSPSVCQIRPLSRKNCHFPSCPRVRFHQAASPRSRRRTGISGRPRRRGIREEPAGGMGPALRHSGPGQRIP